MRRLIRAALAFALVVVPPLPLAGQVAAASSAALPAAVDATGGIRLVNRSTTALQVELRAAIGGSCASGPVGRLQSVAAGATIVVRSSQPLCLRRPLVGARSAGVTGSWVLKPMRRGVIEEVIL